MIYLVSHEYSNNSMLVLISKLVECSGGATAKAKVNNAYPNFIDLKIYTRYYEF